MPDRLTGKASYFTYGGAQIPITKYTAKSTRTLADTTDSADYDSGNNIIYKSQIPVSEQMELSVEGNFYLSITNQTLLTAILTGVNEVPVVLGLNAGALFGSGNFDISDFSTDVPVEDTVKWTATFRSNGPFNPGS